jgi:hypothetical protein
MALKTFLIMLVLLTCFTLSKAQNPSYTVGDMNIAFPGNKDGMTLEKDVKVAGSPFENEDFVSGDIFTSTKQHFKGVPVRYNLYSDRMEFQKPGAGVYEISPPEIVDSIQIGKSTYIFSQFRSRSKIRSGYFKLLTHQSPELLLRMSVVFKPAEFPTGYKDAVPARFVRTSDEFYLLFPGNEAVEFTGKKDFTGFFPSFQTELKEFLKKQRIRFGNPDDLIRLLEYCYSLDK